MLNQMGLGFVFTAKDLATGVIDRVKEGFGDLEEQTEAATRAFDANLSQFGQGLAIMGAGVAGLAVLGHAVQTAGQFSHAIAEVSTLIDEAAFSTADLSRVSLDLAAVYGGSATGQARALYQTISAGVSDAARATDLLRVANELAIGGVTDTKTAVDALTNVVNAYAASGAQARDVSDAFFVAIKAGKTTAAELAATIGRVAPTAASLGVSFSDLLASVAAVTTQGLNTAEAVTGMKAALANIIKPTSDATKEAARLGIKFDAAALRAHGLTGFLQMITSSARFNADSLANLFGSVEALNAVMALTANKSAKYTDVLGQMGARTGATRVAFDKMADTLTFQELRFKALKESVLIVIGQALEPMVKAIVRVANGVLQAFLRIPKPIRDFGVKLFAAVSLLLVLVGGFIAAKAGIALFLLGLKAIGITIAGVLASLLPLVAAFAGFSLIVAGFVVAFRRDVGGIATFFGNVAARVKLAIRGLAQLFEQGGFSGAVMKELGKAENAGIKQFAIRIFQIAFRIKRFFEGIAVGFAAMIEVAGPMFAGLVDALRSLGEALGLLGTGAADAMAGLRSSSFAEAGAVIGQVFGAVVVVTVGALRVVAGAAAAIAGVLRRAFAEARAAFAGLGSAIGETAAAVHRFFTESLPRAARSAAAALRAVLRPVVDFVTGVADGIRASIDQVIAFLGRLVERIPSGFRPAYLDSLVTAGRSAEQRIAERASPVAVGAGGVAAAALPAVAELRARGELAEARAAASPAVVDNRPLQAHMILSVDGETLARATARAERSAAARSFAPVPAPG